MGDLRAGAGGDQRGDAGIAEKVQNPERPAGTLHLIDHPGPVCELLRENADVAERRQAAEEIRIEQPHWPGFAHCLLGKPPAPQPVLVRVAGEDRIGIVPYMRRQDRRP